MARIGQPLSVGVKAVEALRATIMRKVSTNSIVDVVRHARSQPDRSVLNRMDRQAGRSVGGAFAR